MLARLSSSGTRRPTTPPAPARPLGSRRDRPPRAVERAGAPEVDPWDFASAEDTVAALDAAGFRDVDVRVVPDPVTLERDDQLEALIATVLLGATLRDLAPEDGAALVRRVAAEPPEPVIDDVRARISAVRA